MELAIVTSGYLPIPAAKGGAVENLIENFMKVNEEKQKVNLTVFSILDKNAVDLAKKYKKTNIKFIKPNSIAKILDKIIYFLAKNILKKERTQSYRYIFQRLDFLNKVSKDLKHNNYQKILLENHPTLFYCLKWRKNFEKYEGRYYYHIHNEIVNDFNQKELIKNSKKNICVSEFVSKQVQRFLDISAENFVVLRNGIDEKVFIDTITEERKENLKKELGIKEGEIVLLFTGRFTKEKGIDKILLALDFVKEKNFKLVIAGGFFYNTKTKNIFQKDLEEQIAKQKDKVINLGFIPYDKIYELYQIADISIQPSMSNDSAPLTIIESSMCGLPIITTNSGGIPEYTNEKSAIILDRNDKLVEKMAQSIEKLIKNEQLRLDMGKEARRLAKALTIENYYENFFKYLSM